MSGTEYVRYDYAWNTPGWSVQNPSFNNENDLYVAPGLPDDVSVIEVLYEPPMEWDSGRPLEGVLRIKCEEILTHTPTKRQVMPGVDRIRFRTGRGVRLFLPATDDPELVSAEPWKYSGVLTIHGIEQHFEFSLPATTPSPAYLVDLITQTI